MATQAERSAATRSKILASARALFITVGYEATTTAMILAASGVSRGAMYYHFDSKESIFEELYLETSRQVAAHSVAGKRSGMTVRQELIETCVAWLKEASRPDAAAILLELGPAVLGWGRCRELDDEHGFVPDAVLLGQAVSAGELSFDSIELATGMLRAALAEAALMLKNSTTQQPTLQDARQAIESLLGEPSERA